MDIKIKRRSDRKNESIAVIEFKDKKDADLFFMGMKDYLDLLLRQTLKKLKKDVTTNMLILDVHCRRFYILTNLKC